MAHSQREDHRISTTVSSSAEIEVLEMNDKSEGKDKTPKPKPKPLPPINDQIKGEKIVTPKKNKK